MLTKVTKHSKNEQVTAKKQTFVFAVPWIIRNETLPLTVGMWGACPYLTPFYLIAMDC